MINVFIRNLRDRPLNIIVWQFVNKEKTLLVTQSKNYCPTVYPDSVSLLLHSLFLPFETLLNLVWAPEVCGEQQCVRLL